MAQVETYCDNRMVEEARRVARVMKSVHHPDQWPAAERYSRLWERRASRLATDCAAYFQVSRLVRRVREKEGAKWAA